MLNTYKNGGEGASINKKQKQSSSLSHSDSNHSVNSELWKASLTVSTSNMVVKVKQALL